FLLWMRSLTIARRRVAGECAKGMVKGAHTQESNRINDFDDSDIGCREELHRPKHPRTMGKLAPDHTSFRNEAARQGALRNMRSPGDFGKGGLIAQMGQGIIEGLTK